MKIYLIESPYEGCQPITFSTREAAEAYIISEGVFCEDSWIVETTLDGGYAF